MNVTSTTLDNGFKIIFATDNSNPLVCLQLYVRMGSAWEKKEEAGYSHFTEHLVFKSTQNFSQNSIMEKVTFLGGSINAYTEYDTTCFYITLPSSFTKEGIEILAELAIHANYNQQDFTFEKRVVIEELKQFKNDPEEAFIEYMTKHYFQKNPYRNPIIGNLESITKATPNELKNFYKKYYSPENTFLVVSGDISEEKVLNEVEKYYGNWQKVKCHKPPKYKEDFKVEPAIFSYKKKISNDMLAFILPDLSETNPESYALSLAIKAFAIGKNSRLYTRLFNEEKLIDGIKVHALSGINDGASIILIMPKQNANLMDICRIFLEELELFHRFNLNEIELEDNKKELIFYFRYAFEYVETLAASLGSEEVLTGFEKLFEYPDIIRNLESTDIQKVISKYYNKNHLNIFHYGRRKFPQEKIEKQLKSIPISLMKTVPQKDFFETELKNGLKILLKKVKGKPTIGISLSYEVSQLNENKENRGINLFTSGLMLYGNNKRNYQQFLNYCTSNGIHFGINPQMESTTVRLKCFSEMLPVSLELLSEVVLSPSFPSDYFHNLQQTYISSIDRVRDFPNQYAVKLWKDMIFGKNSNMINRTGSKTSIRNISLKQIKNWYETHYNPQNMFLALAGDFDFEKVLQNIEKLFVSSAKNIRKSVQKPMIEANKKKWKRTRKGLDQSVIILGGYGCNVRESDKNTAFHVLAQIIGGDTSSIFFNELREKRGLAYSVEFNLYSIRSTGYWAASAIVDKSREKESVELICSLLKDIKKNGISKKDLEKTKNYIRGQRLMDEESMLNQAQTLSILEAIGFGYEYYLGREERLKKVSLKALHEIADEYFNENDYYIHVLS